MSKFGYLPHTDEDRQHMLRTLGMTHVDELFSDIPDSLQLGRALDLPAGLSEWSLMQHLKELAGRNRHVEDAISFLGAGAYHHHIPSVVDAIIGRSEFYTAYTPYQPEISQGILQAIFEYQTLVCELMGLDVSNASLYDGPTALGEAAMMACSHTRRNRVLVARTVHPEYRSVLGTYARGQHADVVELPMRDGLTDMAALASQLSNEVAAVIVSYPNFFGGIEEVACMATMAHEHGALLIVNTYPIALGLLESPGVLGADIAVAEGQPLGNTLSFGGPYLGMMAVRTELVRKLPGRIAGQTKDRDGRRGFVLTLQAREQHIRREKASSNICSNQALNALAASVYLADLGPQGLAEVGSQCMAKARYAESRFAQVGYGRVHDGPYFHEFVLNLGPRAEAIYERLADEGIYLGYPLGGAYPELAGHVLVAVTEVVTKEQIDETARRLEALR